MLTDLTVDMQNSSSSKTLSTPELTHDQSFITEYYKPRSTAPPTSSPKPCTSRSKPEDNKAKEVRKFQED